jgi:hypothetical protein
MIAIGYGLIMGKLIPKIFKSSHEHATYFDGYFIISRDVFANLQKLGTVLIYDSV